MVAHRSRDADATWRALGFKSRRNIYSVPVQVGAISNGVADVNPDAEPDGAIRGLITVMDRNLLLNWTAQRTAPSMLSNMMRRESPPV